VSAVFACVAVSPASAILTPAIQFSLEDSRDTVAGSSDNSSAPRPAAPAAALLSLAQDVEGASLASARSSLEVAMLTTWAPKLALAIPRVRDVVFGMSRLVVLGLLQLRAIDGSVQHMRRLLVPDFSDSPTAERHQRISSAFPEDQHQSSADHWAESIDESMLQAEVALFTEAPSDDGAKEAKQQSLDAIVFSFLVIQAIVSLYVAKSAGEGIPPLTPEDEELPERYRIWSDRPLDCCADPSVCIFTCLCPCMSFGHNTKMGGCRPLDQYWRGCVAFVLVTLLAMVVGLLGTVLIGNLVYAVRTKLKESYEFHGQNDSIQDFLLACCCPILAIAQEARHIENSKKAGFTFDPAMRWPEGQRPARLANGGAFVGQAVGLRQNAQWSGSFRGAHGTIGNPPAPPTRPKNDTANASGAD